jgi:putative hemolysin
VLKQKVGAKIMLRLSVLLLFVLPALVFCACPNGGYQWQTNCYYFQANGTDFPEAEANCISQGGHLASVHDSFTNALLTGHAVNIFQKQKDYWIGLSNLKTPKKLAWIDGTKLDFVDWDKNQPGNGTGIRCASVDLKTGLWRVESCFQQKPFVCAVVGSGSVSTMGPMTTTTRRNTNPTTTTGSGMTTPSGNKCTGNFTYYGPTNSCYGVFNMYDPDAKPWNASEAFCVGIGGHLASIHSQDEFNFIMSFNYPSNAQYFPWTGLFSADNEQTFQWTDGTPTDFLPWGPEEPVVDTNYNCVFAFTEGFATYDCSTPASTLCKIPLS